MLPPIRLGIICAMISSTPAWAISIQDQQRDVQQQQRQQEQQKARQQTFMQHREVHVTTTGETPQAFPVESPCFPISHIYLTEFSPDKTSIDTLTTKDLRTDFAWALRAVYAPKDFTLPHCLGGQGISEIIKRVQNAIIEKGFVTTRVLAQPQDLRQGRLVLTVIPGKVRHILLRDHSETLKAHKGTVWFALPLGQGDLLNIRDIEQGLENLKRPPHVDSNIQIVPTEDTQALPGESDLQIDFKQAFPYRLALSLDDSGSKATGRLQAGATVSIENLLSLNDIFYGSFTQSISRGSDDPGRHGSRSTSLYYAIPWKAWLLHFSSTQNRYHQTVFGAFTNYEYAGRSETTNIGLSRVLYRSNARKTTLNVGIWHRESHNFVDNAEIDIQRRRMAGWTAGLSHREYFGSATLDINFNYKQGTGAYHSLPAPEEQFGEGTSRPTIITASLSVKQPFTLGQQPFQFNTSWQAQWNKSPLILQDMFSIGGRYTVRGFDGELTLTGERGWVWRNELGWNIANKGHELYLALDGGHVSGNYTKELLGKNLMGGAIGLRGTLWGLTYDYFVGIPLHKPEGFRTSHVTTGFNLSYQF
ncbi:ShlB/FhaC/HecB family hemolysin secretion/activation protein [Gallibacterium melopsittaci]|uniref:ShlB/FhaC/HecB family hemolysin secretion/activation protein n=1 Tax=Gallibacterium melopsittaci TaxID=516063 RepID=A0ABV6HTK4_9PAST